MALTTDASFFLLLIENKSRVEIVPSEINSRTVILIFVGMLAALWDTQPTFPLKLMVLGSYPKTLTFPFVG